MSTAVGQRVAVARLIDRARLIGKRERARWRGNRRPVVDSGRGRDAVNAKTSKRRRGDKARVVVSSGASEREPYRRGGCKRGSDLQPVEHAVGDRARSEGEDSLRSRRRIGDARGGDRRTVYSRRRDGHEPVVTGRLCRRRIQRVASIEVDDDLVALLHEAA